MKFIYNEDQKRGERKKERQKGILKWRERKNEGRKKKWEKETQIEKRDIDIEREKKEESRRKIRE